jgi:hypothetical protein
MKKYLLLLLCLIIIGCEESVTPPLPAAYITAKENITPVVNAAKNTFSADAELAGIYGVNVNASGQIDLLNTGSLNAFVYIMQSDAVGGNEFYVPVYAANPVKSPINFNTMLSFIKDSTASGIVGGAISLLATVSISPSAVYDDSPAIINMLLSRSDVTSFRNANPGSKIDMFLFPSKAIDPNNGLDNSADWVVNFYSDNESLVLWRNTSSGLVTVLSN